MRVFIIGPGGVGKTTSGKILADLLGTRFIDLDQEFCDQIEEIGKFIREKGYEKYCYDNSELFQEILADLESDFVFALSSGFLVHENLDKLVAKHKKLLANNGISVLLLPAKSLEESIELVVSRQLKRGFGLKESREREKFIKRYPEYFKLGDIKIFSHAEPIYIANLMKEKLEKSDN
jgi:shikimate kinase